MGVVKTIDYGEMGAGEKRQPARRREGLTASSARVLRTDRRVWVARRKESGRWSLGPVGEATDWHEEMSLRRRLP
jgi:hypothetical protein